MIKKETGRKAWNTTKELVSCAVGLGTGVLVESMCAGFAPAEGAGIVARVGFKAGRHGLSIVCGSAAKSLTKVELDSFEKAFTEGFYNIKETIKKDETDESQTEEA